MVIDPASKFAADIEVASTEILVLGGGLAGHRAALAARQEGRQVAMAFYARGASPYVIGFNVPLGHADPRDSPDVYFNDTLNGGYLLNDRRLVHILTTQAAKSLDELVALGVPFACDGNRFLQRHLSGNSYPRSVYASAGTGRLILERMAAACLASGIERWLGYKAISLLKDEGRVIGCLLYRRQEKRLLAVAARAVVLAMGGIGRLYADSTYPADVGADAYGLAYEAGATLIDMEFVQFEPVVTVYPQGCRGMEMPTAMLGDGAHLLNSAGERFMFRYNPEHGEKRIEKARLALCIQREIDEGRGLSDGSVLFDTTVMPADKLESYIAHCQRLRAAGLDPAKEMPHVRPAAHSEMGGIAIDEWGWSGVPGLYVGGEAAGGVHGASRLAGNGATDTIVFGAVAGQGAARGLREPAKVDLERAIVHAFEGIRSSFGAKSDMSVTKIKTAIQSVVSNCAGLYRSADSLTAGLDTLSQLQANLDSGGGAAGLEEAIGMRGARNMLLIGRVILKAALTRTESRGAHQRTDFPNQDQSWLRHIGFQQSDTGDEMTLLPIR